MDYKTEYQRRMETPCLPPKQYINFAHSFWVNRRDADGRSTSYTEVWQWQPNAKSWCRPGMVATGQENLLLGYEVLALCPMPLGMIEADQLFTTLSDISQRFKDGKAEINIEEFRLIHQHIFESMSMERDFNQRIRSNV